MFRDATRRQRALIPADGFYERKAVPGESRKVPCRFTLADGGLFALAGVWEHWQGSEGGVGSCAILTTRPSSCGRPEFEGMWIDPALTDPALLAPAFEPLPAAEVAAYVVSTRVNAARSDDAECVRPVA